MEKETLVKVTFQDNPLFSSSDGAFFPGRSLSKEILVENSSSQSVSLSVFGRGNGEKPLTTFQVTIGESPSLVHFAGSLTEFLDQPAVSLGKLPAKQSRRIVFTLAIPREETVTGRDTAEFVLSVRATSAKQEEKGEVKEGEKEAEGTGKEQVVSQEDGAGEKTEVIVTDIGDTGEEQAQPAEDRESVQDQTPSVSTSRQADHQTQVGAVAGVQHRLPPPPPPKEFESVFSPRASWRDVLLQNSPNLPVLFVEEFVLLLLAVFFARRSGYLGGRRS